MKKYISAILIPCLLLYLCGCYSMEEITKQDFSSTPDYPKILVKTEKEEITFNKGEYSVKNDTIFCQGTCRKINNIEEPFDSSLGLTDVQEIQMEEFNLGNTIAFGSIVIVVIAGFIALHIATSFSLDFNHP